MDYLPERLGGLPATAISARKALELRTTCDELSRITPSCHTHYVRDLHFKLIQMWTKQKAGLEQHKSQLMLMKQDLVTRKADVDKMNAARVTAAEEARMAARVAAAQPDAPAAPAAAVPDTHISARIAAGGRKTKKKSSQKK